MPDSDLQRGVTQLVSGVCWALFATGMFVRAWRRYRIGWPIAWGLLVGMALASVAYSQITHGIYWLGILHSPLTGWPLLLPLYFMAVTSVWTLWRWARDGDTTELLPPPESDQ